MFVASWAAFTACLKLQVHIYSFVYCQLLIISYLPVYGVGNRVICIQIYVVRMSKVLSGRLGQMFTFTVHIVIVFRNMNVLCTDQELADAAVYAGRHFVSTHQVAALFYVKWRHSRHLESETSNQKFNSVSLCIITWRTIPPNFIPIRFEMTEPLAFLKRSSKQEQEERQDE